MPDFLARQRTPDIFWRSVILFGRNVASYKFALAQSLIELSAGGDSYIPLSDLAVPFSRNLIAHLRQSPKQATSASSRFLEACREADAGKLTEAELVGKTVALGFNNVIDAFHIVNQGEIPVRFFVASLTPASRASSLGFCPASIRFSVPMICSSVCRLFFIAPAPFPILERLSFCW
ncbi:MAG: hypothetical protein FJW38_17060 [Acidobacteria bacterium]|nr:hypothetical protein [Acidobacteriota bacterium]